MNCVFLGTNARSGTARCLIVATGLRTQFGAIAHRLTLRPPETEFDRHLTAIENLGSMDVLCTDKTGTLTEGVVVLEGAYDALGWPSARVQEQGAWNAALETGLASALDDAILSAAAPDLSTVRKLAEMRSVGDDVLGRSLPVEIAAVAEAT